MEFKFVLWHEIETAHVPDGVDILGSFLLGEGMDAVDTHKVAGLCCGTC